MKYENFDSKSNLSIEKIVSMIDETIYGNDTVDQEQIKQLEKEGTFNLLDRLLYEDWFSIEDLQRIITDNGIAHLPYFIINVNELAIGAKECDLSNEELSLLKSKVGLIDTEMLINSLRKN